MTTEPMGADAPAVTGDDLPGAAQQTQAELDAEEAKARTTYFLLVAEGADGLWREVEKIVAAGRPAAWEEAKRRHPEILPTEDGAQVRAQLVPKRFWQAITATLRRPEPQVEVEGL